MSAPPAPNARYYSGFYPMHLALLSVARNVLPVAWWTPVSKDPFRFVVAIDRRNHSLALLRGCGEAALHFLPWRERERVIRAGYASGRRRDKASRLGFELEPATALAETYVVRGADAVFELRVRRELVDADDDGDHVPFLFDVVHVHRGTRPATGEPLLFLGWRDFATLGERWRFRP
ncbi:MAG: flavin reductase family protein [Deltaproteobacteria bacterium]|nr:flavin reductase family protein [Deltaproteobacteria bacterium]